MNSFIQGILAGIIAGLITGVPCGIWGNIYYAKYKERNKPKEPYMDVTMKGKNIEIKGMMGNDKYASTTLRAIQSSFINSEQATTD